MGKISDAVLALIILIIGLYVLTKLGLTAGAIWSMLKQFFSSPTPGNTTSGAILGITTNAKMKEKIREKREWFIHMIRSRQLKGIKR